MVHGVRVGVKGQALDWIASYLSGITQAVKIGDNYSKTFRLECGVPQGSVQGPVLADVARADNVRYKLYADDNQLWISFRPIDGTHAFVSGSQIQPCLHDIDDWMVHNKLQNNRDTLLALLVGTCQHLTKINFNIITLGNIEVKISSEVRNLGVIFDQELSMAGFTYQQSVQVILSSADQ